MLQISNPEDNFAIQKSETDEWAQTHIWLKQTYKGVVINGADLVAHVINGDSDPVGYWDVGTLNVWDGSKGDFADGKISKPLPNQAGNENSAGTSCVRRDASSTY